MINIDHITDIAKKFSAPLTLLNMDTFFSKIALISDKDSIYFNRAVLYQTGIPPSYSGVLCSNLYHEIQWRNMNEFEDGMAITEETRAMGIIRYTFRHQFSGRSGESRIEVFPDGVLPFTTTNFAEVRLKNGVHGVYWGLQHRFDNSTLNVFDHLILTPAHVVNRVRVTSLLK